MPAPPAIDVGEATREHYPRLYRAALVLTGSPWDAEDLAQETFLVMARDPSRFEGRSNLYTWLYGILLNLERRSRRQMGTHRRKLKVVWENDTQQPAAVPAAETRLEVGEWKDGLWAHVADLPDLHRQALVLRFSEQLSYQEIAEVMNCPLGTVKSRIFNGLGTLRDKLADAPEGLREVPRHVGDDATDVG